MVVHGPGIGSEARAGCAWEQGWLMGVVARSRARTVNLKTYKGQND